MVSSSVIVEGYNNGREGSQLNYRCRSGLEPSESFVSTCTSGGIWSPNPADHICKGVIIWYVVCITLDNILHAFICIKL